MPIKWTTWGKNGQILRKHNLPRLNQDEVENMNRKITSSEMEAIIELYPTTTKKNAQGQVNSQANSTKC